MISNTLSEFSLVCILFEYLLLPATGWNVILAADNKPYEHGPGDMLAFNENLTLACLDDDDNVGFGGK